MTLALKQNYYYQNFEQVLKLFVLNLPSWVIQDQFSVKPSCCICKPTKMVITSMSMQWHIQISK